jgi:DNA repair exonuclease SbcCD ATPase subunit
MNDDRELLRMMQRLTRALDSVAREVGALSRELTALRKPESDAEFRERVSRVGKSVNESVNEGALRAGWAWSGAPCYGCGAALEGPLDVFLIGDLPGQCFCQECFYTREQWMKERSPE